MLLRRDRNRLTNPWLLLLNVMMRHHEFVLNVGTLTMSPIRGVCVFSVPVLFFVSEVQGGGELQCSLQQVGCQTP